MSTPHKHCDIIKAWADGKKIQFSVSGKGGWRDIKSNATPEFDRDLFYRVKPEFPIQNFDVPFFVGSLKNYWDVYPHQEWYEKYTTDTVLTHALYGIGMAIDPKKYQYAEGYREFLKDLKSWLNNS